MNRYQRTVMACLRTARDDRTFWTPLEDSKEKRAAFELIGRGLLVAEKDPINAKCLWVAPTWLGLKYLRETDDQCPPTS